MPNLTPHLAARPAGLNDSAWYQQMMDWNATEIDYGHDACLHELFEEQVARTPTAVAAAFEGQSLTYQELNQRANQLSRYLRRLGVGGEVLVGIYAERSLEMVVGLLGILKAGGAYVPFDPTYPTERIQFMLADAQTPVLLTQSHLIARLPEHEASVVCLDRDWDQIEQEAAENSEPLVTADNLAYMIYTSGSTGKPKGALNTHRGIVNRLRWMQQQYGLEDSDRVLQKTPFSFDVSVWEFFWPLITGARLVLARPEGHKDSAYLVDLIVGSGITTLHFVPSMLHIFLDTPGLDACTSVKRVLCSGEALPLELQARFFARFAAELHNLYGPTEAAIDVTFWPCQRKSEGSSVPIGRPIANTQIYILNNLLTPVGPGESGELHIGGVQVARGYHRRPALTAEKFIPDPFSATSGARLYKTGDLARWLPDGAIEFLGRIDHQVKLRGFRIELGEIEATLMQHPTVHHAVVIVHQDAASLARLIAYVVTAQGQTLPLGELRTFLGLNLPDYMVPATFVQLDALPLTPNGKLDRAALPAPTTNRPNVATAYVAPRTATEETLAGIWSELLNVDRVGIHDNVFELGGHSLIATQAITRIRQILHAHLPLRVAFETPTIAGLAQLIDLQLQEQQRHQPAIIKPVSRDQPLPPSPSQERVCFIQELDPSTLAYQFQATLRFTGTLNIALLEQSLDTIIERHEIFRTTFPLVDGRFVQQIHEPWQVKLPIDDFRSLSAAERDAEVQRIIRETVKQPMNIAQLPLAYWRLMWLRDDEYLLLHIEHHLIHDGWSFNAFLREFVALYQGLAVGKPAPLPELPIQFADFAVWQRQWMESEEAAQQLAYWQRQLAAAPPLLELPTDRPRPSVQTFRGAAPRLELPVDLSERLRAVSRREGVTLFVALLAAFKTLMYRYSGQEDILIGSGIANRRLSESEHLIGMLVNNVVLRASLSDDMSFRDLLRQVRSVALDAYDHQDLPFDKVVDVLQPERNLSYNPVFQVMFSFHDSPLPTLELPGLNIQLTEAISNRSAKFDLNIIAIPRTEQRIGHLSRSEPRGVTLVWEYNSDLFNADTIERMVAHYQMILEAMSDDVNQHLGAVPLLTNAERQLLVAWNTPQHYQRQETLPALFEAQVAQRPDAIAVVFEDRRLSYAELDGRANQLAHYLRGVGVQPGQRVGLYLERSLDVVVAILGVLKAGGVYLPLDPSYPDERLRFMLEDAQAPVLLTHESLQPALPALQTRVICLDRDWSRIAEESAAPVAALAAPDDPAYVIYTSGSTGTPKGVLVSHSNVARLFTATNDWFHFSNQDVWTLFHSYAFDFSVWELWGALLYGGRLVVVPYLVSRSPEAFYRLLCAEQVTVLNQTPSAFRQLMRAEEAVGTVPDLALRLVIFGGEALEFQSLRPWFERHGDQRPQLVNMYGITETTVHVTYRPVSIADLEQGAKSVIGRPIPDLQVYVLDRRLQPAPIGVPGEMYVGGAGVALGYLNRPELTAQRFVRNPFSDSQAGDGETRLYRTGDLARYLPNGDLEYLGRCDDQVKIRGFRIELGEIEAVLAQHPAVREVAVLTRQESSIGGEHDRRLVAYLATKADHAPTINELRAFLQSKLPEYMVPAAFVLLDALPLTPNGKLDRRALPEPDSNRPELGTIFVAPRSPLESTLAAIYSEVLGIEQVGVYDNFFALGGDSIRSVRMIAQARTHGIELTLPLIFQNQTIADLAERLSLNSAPASQTERTQPFALVKPEDRERLPRGIDDAYPLTMLQAGMLFHSEFSPDTTVYHNVTSFQVHSRFDQTALEESVRQLVARHPVLRTSFDMHSFSEPLQLVHSSATVPVHIADLRQLSAEEQSRRLDAWFEAEKQHKFSWTRPPLLRFQAHRLSDASFMLSWTEHHAIVDGWSVASMITELLKEYFGLLGERIDPISAPEVTFRDYVATELQALESEQQRQFWAEKLRDHTLTTLPRWSWAAAEPGLRQIRLHEMPLTPELSADLRRVAQAIGVPLKHVLLAAHLRVLSALTGQADVTSGLVTNGRLEEMDGDRVLGLFLNTLPLRVQMHGGSWIDLIRQSFAAEQELSPFRRYPLSALQQANAGQPLFEAVFNFVHFHVYEAILELPHVKLLKRKFIQETNFDFIANFRLLLDRDQIQVDIEYDPGSFADEQIAAIQGYYLRALQAIAGDPHGRYQTFSLLAEEERQRMLTWNVREVAYPQDRCVHELFAAQAAQTPDATALIAGDARLSYAELDRRANQLAHHLRSLGVKPNVGVGLCMERSLDLVVGLLGILKAGGAYVPLDPAYPAERLQFMLQDAQVPVLLMQAQLSDSLATEVMKVRIDADWPEIAGHPATAPDSGVGLDHPAYLIYTSGTTGRPKAVLVEHGNLLNVCQASQDVFAFSAQDTMPCIASFAFDIFLFELLNPLLSGGTSLMIDRQQVLETARLVDELQRATTVHAVPSLMQQIVSFINDQGLGRYSFDKLRALFVGGDAVPVDLLDAMRHTFPAAQIHVLYGPTEGTIICSSYSVPVGQPITGKLIGKSLPNYRLRLYSPEQMPVPIGVPGELYIGGAGVARGYLGQPELTAQKFVEIDGMRWYRTGDLACYQPDGTIEFLGRIDQQVKLRGFRVELGEIEAVLRQHSAVREALVVVHETASETGEQLDKRLVAYLVEEHASQNGARLAHNEAREQPVGLASELRGFLKERLPEYMIPSAFVVLPALPLTPNGKVDRRALPKPDLTRPDLAQAYVAPSTRTEEILASMWSQLLKIDRVGIHDNFFELGGHSLLSTQLISRVRDSFQVETPLRVLFDTPTIAALAQAIDSHPAQHQAVDRIAAVPRSSDDLDWLLSEIDDMGRE